MKISEVVSDTKLDLKLEIRKLLGKRPTSEAELAEAISCSVKQVSAALKELRASGANISRVAGEKLFLTNLLERGGSLTLKPRERGDGWTVIGFVTDNHLCNKHERLDVLNIAYDTFAEEGVTEVLNAGNWVEGEARFNRQELIVAPGMDPQLDYWIDRYPQRLGITTHYVTGDDHEGWWIQRECINVGQYAQMKAEKAGREDLKYLGHVEADIRLKCGKGSAVARLMHPGGGSAYALSYAPQKLVESFQGGEKPSILFIGHYHKWDYCVPLSAEILTRDGWKTKDELREDSEVLGYNTGTDRCEWTRVLAINTFKNKLVRRYHNKIFDVRCTPDHKWPLIKKFQSRVELGTIEETACQPRIVQAATAPDGPGLGRLDTSQFLSRRDGVQNVLLMTSGERRAFILGMMYGEGSHSGSGTVKFAQNPGPVTDAFRLACFLEGIATSTGTDYRPCISSALLTRRFRETRSLRASDDTTEDVWCPTTGLGTWVMRQGRTITITGNCFPREVHCISGGCTVDQTAFLRKNKIAAHVGFSLVKFKQDPADGHITRLAVEWCPFYDRGYYERRFG